MITGLQGSDLCGLFLDPEIIINYESDNLFNHNVSSII